MVAAESRPVGAIDLNQLVALNDEMAALVRAGVPLEEGLAELGADMPGRLGTLMTRLADDAKRGRPLGETFADPSLRLPPVYRAVIEAGIRADRLPAALESVAGAIRRLAAMHRCIAIASIYPLVVVCAACCLFAVFTVHIAPQILATSNYFQTSSRGILETMVHWGRSANTWGFGLPAVFIAVWLICVGLSRRAATFNARRARWSLICLPWLGPVLRWSRAAVFTDLLAMLLEHDVPLHEAVRLAGEATGDPGTIDAAKTLAAALERGEPLNSGLAALPCRALPPMLHWLIQSASGREAMLASLRAAAESYRVRAQYRADLLQVFVPVVLSLVIGGTATLLYALAVFGPYIAFLWKLS